MMKREDRSALVAAVVVMSSLILTSCDSSNSQTLLLSFPLPENLNIFAQDIQNFKSSYYAVYPSVNGTVIYGTETQPTAATKAITSSIYLRKGQVASHLNTSTENPSLTLGTTFAASVTTKDLFLLFEGPEQPPNNLADLYTAHFDLSSMQLKAQPSLWTNPLLPEPVYNLTGAFLGDFSFNSSQVISRSNVSRKSYSTAFSPDGAFVYLLVRTDLLGSLKLLKYNAIDSSLIWRQIIKPQVQGETQPIITSGVGILQIDFSTGDLFLLVDVDPQEMPAMLTYLKITPPAGSPPLGSALLRIDHNTGIIVGCGIVDLSSVAGGYPFVGRYVPSSMTVSPSQGLLYLTVNGVLNNSNHADMILQYSINDLNNNGGTRKNVLLSLFPQAVASACSPATVSSFIHSIALNGSSLLIAGHAGYSQGKTGAISAGGKAFIATMDPTSLMAGTQTSIRVEYFGVSSNDNSASQISISSDGSIYCSAVINRGLSTPQGQNSMLFVLNKSLITSCSGSDWWLTCRDGGCLEWCFAFPVNSSTKEKSFPPCGNDEDDEDEISDTALAGIIIGVVAGVLIIGLFVVTIGWGLYKLKQHRRGYIEVGGGVDSIINETITKGLK